MSILNKKHKQKIAIFRRQLAALIYLTDNASIMKARMLEKKLIALMVTRTYSFATIAFIKFADPGGPEQMKSFVVGKNQDLLKFIYRITCPNLGTFPGRIKSENVRFIAFHKKVKGDKNLNMISNPEYLISWTQRRGFFDKNCQSLPEVVRTRF